jgi:hypothetical protein
MQCPFCSVEKNESAPVCASCGRDTAVPDALVAERAELLQKRDALRAELNAANARLATRRGRKPTARLV